jgi:hypothetical protein
MCAFFAAKRRKKPGFPLQFLGFAYANPVGFPLQSRLHGRVTILLRKIVTSQDAWASNNFAKQNYDQPPCAPRADARLTPRNFQRKPRSAPPCMSTADPPEKAS